MRVPADAAPGDYTGELTFRPARGAAASLPIHLRVLPFTLEEADFTVGFWGFQLEIPWEKQEALEHQRQMMRTFREAGMTSFTGGPMIPFRGLDASGQPLLDFAAADAYLKMVRELGFSREFLTYGGLGHRGAYRRV